MNLDFLKLLVEIDSNTQNIAGVNQVQKIVGSSLSSLGFDVKFLRNNQDKTGELLFAQRKGHSLKAITLVCHAVDAEFDCLDWLTILDLTNIKSSYKKRYFKNEEH